MKMTFFEHPSQQRRVQSVVDIFVLFGAMVVLGQCVDNSLLQMVPSTVQGHVESSSIPGKPVSSVDESQGVEIIVKGPIEEEKIREVSQLMGRSAVIRYQY